MWQNKNNKLVKDFTFDSFIEAQDFIGRVAGVAETEQHHPRIINDYTKVTLELSTHDANNTVTEKDVELSRKIDHLYGSQELQTIPKKVKLFADGGSRGNPGPSAGGYVILDMDNNVVKSNGKFLGITTNNQAEYHSLKGGLEMALELGVNEIEVYMDSLLVVNQMKGIYKIKNRDLWPIYDAIQSLLPRFHRVSFSHVPRELNTLADAEVNKVLDAELKSPKSRP